MKKRIILVIVFIFSISALKSQTELPKPSLNIGADIMSRYVWRGTDFGRSPSIQPFLSLSYKDLEIGTWGAFMTNNTGMQEVDLYVSYSPINELTITATDYFFPVDSLTENKYFEYGSDKTTHLFELSASFNGTENLPLNILIATVIYGDDKVNTYVLGEPNNSDNNYSTYIELGYSLTFGENICYTFMGITTHDGLYGGGFNVINIGVTGYRDIKFNDRFSLPLSSSLIINPQKQNIFLVFGLSL